MHTAGRLVFPREAIVRVHSFGHVRLDQSLVRAHAEPLIIFEVFEQSGGATDREAGARWHVHVARRRYDHQVRARRLVGGRVVNRLEQHVTREDGGVGRVEDNLCDAHEAARLGIRATEAVTFGHRLERLVFVVVLVLETNVPFELVYRVVRRFAVLHRAVFVEVHQRVAAIEVDANLVAEVALGAHTPFESLHAVVAVANRTNVATSALAVCEVLDDDGVVDEPVRIAATLTVKGDELRVDFTGTSKQVLGPLNARLSAARACVYFAAKAVLDPDLPTNAGAYRPIDVFSPEGTILQATYPAAIGNANILTDQRVIDVLLAAFYQIVPNRVCAACSGEMNLLNIGGMDPRNGDYYNYVETYAGGQGAMHDLDGSDGLHTHLTNTRNAPIEVIERTYPLQVLQYGLVPDTCGHGRQRGGCGLVRELKCLGERTTITIGADRRKFVPWGLESGTSAEGAHTWVISPDGSKRELPTKVHDVLKQGEQLYTQTPGGGGWGDPSERDQADVERDVEDELISAEQAAEVYGKSRKG